MEEQSSKMLFVIEFTYSFVEKDDCFGYELESTRMGVFV